MAVSNTRTPAFEFIALMAMLMALVAFSIDAMLPAMGMMGADLSPDDPLRVKLVVPLFLVGLGLGTLFTGPLSDAFGRRAVFVCGAALYCVGAALAWAAPSLEFLLAARFVQGVGASGARVVALAIIRDSYKGRDMARISSLVIMVFTLVPALAPSIGALLMWMFGWRGIFAACVFFAIAVVTWFILRQPETLIPAHRRPLNPRLLRAATRELMSHPLVLSTIAVQVTCYGMLFTMLSVTQPIFERVLGAADTFHLWFAAVVVVGLAGPILNAKLVVSQGMHRIVGMALTAQIVACVFYLSALETQVVSQTTIIAFFLWQGMTFIMAGLTLGNLNALALEPMGHMAGTASSLITALATVGGALLSVPASSLFVDSQVPVIWAVLGLALVGRALMVSPGFETVRQPA